MLAIVPARYGNTASAHEQYFAPEASGKLKSYLAEAEQSLAALDYIRTAWAFRCAFALLLEDFRRKDASLTVAQRCALYAGLCRAWQATYSHLPQEHRDVAAMCGFIERQRRRVEFFACG